MLHLSQIQSALQDKIEELKAPESKEERIPPPKQIYHHIAFTYIEIRTITWTQKFSICIVSAPLWVVVEGF